MFEGITTARGNVGRRSSSMVVSVVLHGAVIALGIFIGYVQARLPKEEEPVSVVFRAPPPPPPPPPAGKKKATVKREVPRPVMPKLPPNAIIQPKEVPKIEEKPVEEAPADDGEDDGVEGGVEGGVVGGVVGGVLGGELPKAADEPAVLLGAGMSRPMPTADCQPPKPIAPEQARQMGITGLVLVEYVVHSDGHVGEIKLKNPTAPPMLFEAVEKWLKGCPHVPSMAGSKPLAVKIVQPFNFKPGQ